jgi:hypothetical protein
VEGGKRKVLGQFIMAFAVLTGVINVVQYSKGEGNAALAVAAACLVVLGVIVLAGARKSGA